MNTASAVVLAALAAVCASAPMPRLAPTRAIDPHVHLLNVSLPFTQYETWRYTNPLVYKDWDLQDYSDAQTVLPVQDIVFIEVFGSNPGNTSVTADFGIQEAQHWQAVADAMAASSSSSTIPPPKIGGIVARTPLELGKGVVPYLDTLVQTVPLLKGIRSTPNYTSPDFMQGLRELAARNLSFDVLMQYEALADVTAMVKSVPELTFIVDHMAGPNITTNGEHFKEWAAGIDALSALPNAHIKISGGPQQTGSSNWTVAEVQPFVLYAIKKFGVSRSLWGGNWFWINNYSTLEKWSTGILQMFAGFSQDEIDQLFYRTTRAVYRLDL